MLLKLMERVLEEAEPHLKGKGLRVADGVVGLNFVGLQLSSGRSHFVYLMRESLPSGDMIFPYGEGMLGMDAWEVAQWALTGAEDLQRSLGVAALNAASPFYQDPRYQSPEDFYDGITARDVMGVIGHMPPLVERFAGRVREYISFDRAIDLRGSVEGARVYPVEREAELLPRCDIVVITGTSMINHTTQDILSMCSNARDILLSGFSLPYYPEAYRDSGITAMGSVRYTEDSAALFRPLSLAAGRCRVRAYTQHCYYRLRPPKKKEE